MVLAKGYGYGDGDGYGYGSPENGYLNDVANKLQAKRVLSVQNIELRRIMIEVMGSDRFFNQLEAQVVHSDVDGCGNPRSLIRYPLIDTEAGYLQAVKVVCPTTGRVYHLGVPPSVITCQEAVASTFGIRPEEYNPERES